MRTSDPASCVAAAKHPRFSREKQMRAPRSKEENEAARQTRLNQHMGDFHSFRSPRDFVEEMDDLSLNRI